MPLPFRYLAKKAGSENMAIAGTGLRVYTILGLYEMGYGAEYIADAHDVPLPGVFEALAYAYDHPEEMAAIRKGDEEAEQRSLTLLTEELRRLAMEGIKEDERDRQEAVRKTREARLGTPVF